MEYINIRNTNLTFAAKLTTDQTPDFSVGSATGTLSGAAAINNNKLEILDDNAGWLEYNAVGNCDSPQVGTILFKFTPNFDDSSIYGQGVFYCSKGEGDQTNQINLAINPQEAGGTILLQANDSSNTGIISSTFPAYSWVEDTEYIIQINYDFNAGNTRLYVNGLQHGETQTATGTRDLNINLFRFGCGWDIYSSSPSNFSIDDICIFKTVQAPISEYTIGYQFDSPDDLTTLVKLYGHIYDCGEPISDIEVRVRPFEAGFCNPAVTGTGIFHNYDWKILGETSFDGYFEGEIYLQPTGKKWEIKIGNQSYSFELPDQASAELSTLTLTPVII